MSPSPKRCRPEADTPSQMAAGVSARERSQPRDRRGPSGHERCAAPPHWGPQQVYTRLVRGARTRKSRWGRGQGAWGPRLPVPHNWRPHRELPTVTRFRRTPAGQGLGRWASLPSSGGGGPRSPQGHAGANSGGGGLTGGGAGTRSWVQEASGAGTGGCGCCYSATAESGAEHDGYGGAQSKAEGKPGVNSRAARELVGAGLTHRRTEGGA